MIVTAADPFELPNPAAVLLILLLGLVTVPGLAGYAVITMVRHGIRRSGMAVTLRYLAALAAAGAIAMYAWGTLHLLVTDASTADRACETAVGPARAEHVDRYESSFVPLRFGCHVAGGGRYEAVVPGYVSPTVLGLAFLTVTLAVFAALESSDRTASDQASTERQS